MIENILIKKLDKAVGNIRAYGEVPKDKPSEYILVEKTGGALENQIWKSIIAIKSISAKSKYRASFINDEVIKFLLTYQDADIASCALNTSYEYTNTSTKEYRYQAVFQITHYQEG